MPSINEVIERVSQLRPDAIDDETKAAWLLELDGQIFRDVILRHRLTTGRYKRGPAESCPVCGGTPDYDPVMDGSACVACGWSQLPKYPVRYPEDGDIPLLVEPPYDGLYDLYLMSKADFLNREPDNYNNSVQAYNAALDEYLKQYHRTHMPIGVCVPRFFAPSKFPPAPGGGGGTSGVTPTIGDNGNWYLGDTDTGKPSRGETGPQGPAGADGKSAYQYAQDGGYTGTEAEFAAKLAAEIPTDSHINELIDTKLGVIENGAY